MDKETSRDAFLKALQKHPVPEQAPEEDEEFVYRGNVKKDLEIPGLEYIALEEEEKERETLLEQTAGEEPDITVSLATRVLEVLQKVAKIGEKALLFVFAPVIKPFRKGADTITRRDWVVFFLLLGGVGAFIAASRVAVRVQDSCRKPEDAYVMLMGEKETSDGKGKLMVQDDGTVLMKAGSQEMDVTSLPVYSASESRVLLPWTGMWYDTDSETFGKTARYAEAELKDGVCTVTQRHGAQVTVGGFLYDNADTYLTLEPVSLEYNGTRMDLPALSYVKVQEQGAIDIYPYGGEGIYDGLTTDAVMKFAGGGSVNLGMDIMYYTNGSFRLLYTGLDAISLLK